MSNEANKTTVSYKDLLAQRAELDKQIQQIRSEERNAAIASVREMIAEHELTQEELFAVRKPRSSGGDKKSVAAKYRDPETGATWTGRGKPPTWIKDKNREDFLIPEAQ